MNLTNTPNIKINNKLISDNYSCTNSKDFRSNSIISKKVKRTFSEFLKERENLRNNSKDVISLIENTYEILSNEENSDKKLDILFNFLLVTTQLRLDDNLETEFSEKYKRFNEIIKNSSIKNFISKKNVIAMKNTIEIKSNRLSNDFVPILFFSYEYNYKKSNFDDKDKELYMNVLNSFSSPSMIYRLKFFEKLQ